MDLNKTLFCNRLMQSPFVVTLLHLPGQVFVMLDAKYHNHGQSRGERGNMDQHYWFSLVMRKTLNRKYFGTSKINHVFVGNSD